MNFVEQRIVTDGIVGSGDVLKVDSFLNHRMDVEFLQKVGQRFYELFGNEGVNKILTVESSGIGIACITAQYFGVPVVFAKKAKTSNLSGDVYTAPAHSYTHGNDVTIMVSRRFLGKEDRVLMIDDFLACGSALEALSALVSQAGAQPVGAGIVIEKAYQGGSDALRAKGLRIESLARIASMSPENGIVFCD